MILKLASSFLKWAQIDFSSPELSWVPKEFQELEPFKTYPLKQVIKKFEEFGLADFREEVKTFAREKEGSKLLEAITKKLALITEDVDLLISDLEVPKPGENEKEISDKYLKIYKLNDFLRLVISSLNYNKEKFFVEGTLKTPFDFYFPEIIGGKKIPQGTSLFRAYNKILEKVNVITGISVDHYLLENLSEFKEYSAATKNNSMFIVFSTKINDLVGIGSRGIRSCQSLFCEDEKNVVIDSFNKSLVGTVLSRYIGVIYLTTGTDFHGRGERMIARCLVRLVYNTIEEKFYLFIDLMYPREKNEYRNLFYEALKKRSSINVIKSTQEFKTVNPNFDPDLDEAPQELVHPLADEDISKEFLSYRDTTFQNSVGQLYKDLESDNYNKKKRAILSLPISVIEEYIYDADERIPPLVISRLPEEKLKQQYASHPNYRIREEMAKRVGAKNPKLFFQDDDIYVIHVVLKQLSNDQKIEIFLYGLKNLDQISQTFMNLLVKFLPPDFVFQHLTDGSFNENELSDFFYTAIRDDLNKARKMLLIMIADGHANLASSVLERSLDEGDYDAYYLTNLIEKIPNDTLTQLLNASLNKTVWEIYQYGLSTKKLQDLLNSLTQEQTKQVFRFDYLYEHYFPNFAQESFPAKTEKRNLLKEKLELT